MAFTGHARLALSADALSLLLMDVTNDSGGQGRQWYSLQESIKSTDPSET